MTFILESNLAKKISSQKPTKRQKIAVQTRSLNLIHAEKSEKLMWEWEHLANNIIS